MFKWISAVKEPVRFNYIEQCEESAWILDKTSTIIFWFHMYTDGTVRNRGSLVGKTYTSRFNIAVLLVGFLA